MQGRQAAIGVDELLREARRGLRRLRPHQAWAAVAACGGLIVDIRSDDQRRAGGLVPDARVICRSVLEWRADPDSGDADHALTRCRGPLVLLCQQGYQSSLAAASLIRLGRRATDVIDGFEGWLAAGLPVLPPSAGGLGGESVRREASKSKCAANGL